MASFEISVEIDRPLREVFDYFTDLARIPEWNSVVLEVTPSAHPIQVGSTAKVRLRMLGRTIEATQEVLEYERDRTVVVRTAPPLAVTDTWLFEPLGSGRTRLTYGSAGTVSGFFKLADPIVARVAKKQLTAQLETLKELLEAGVVERSVPKPIAR
ncbi:MAG: SRPBCC family protein [Candidatus Dormibacteraceae bacterium]